jgi:hypothetical protein
MEAPQHSQDAYESLMADPILSEESRKELESYRTPNERARGK